MPGHSQQSLSVILTALLPVFYFSKKVSMNTNAPSYLPGILFVFLILTGLQSLQAEEMKPPRFLAAWGEKGSNSGQFNRPVGIAVDSENFVYVADPENQRIQKFTADGEFILSWGKLGKNTGEFNRPMRLSITPQGEVYVGEFANDRVQIFDRQGRFLRMLGSSGSGPGQLSSAGGVAVDKAGRVYVADFYNHRIQRFAKDGSPLPHIGEKGRVFGGNFDYPTDVVISSDGFLYVADAYNNRIQKFTLEGEFIIKWGGFLGTGLKGSGAGSFYVASAVETDSKRRVYVADFFNHRIQVFTPDGEFLVEWGRQGKGVGEFDYVNDVAVNKQGMIYVVDAGNHRIQKFAPLSLTK